MLDNVAVAVSVGSEAADALIAVSSMDEEGSGACGSSGPGL